MTAFEKWLATSPLASALKISVAGALAAVVGYALTSDWDPLFVVVGAAVLTPLINYLNPQDHRYGTHSEE
jgi:hypothetical protein